MARHGLQRRLLARHGGITGYMAQQAGDGSGDRLVGNNIADTPAGQGLALGKAVDDDKPVETAGRHQREMVVVNQFAIYVVGYNRHAGAF